MRMIHERIEVATDPGISFHDVTESLHETIARHHLRNGFLVISSRHTTTALLVNEAEPRLLEDIKDFLGTLVPASAYYRHNDIHLRDCLPDEPENAHSHIAAMLLSRSEVVPVADGRFDLGRWQSILLVELDGPRHRSLGLLLCGE